MQEGFEREIVVPEGIVVEISNGSVLMRLGQKEVSKKFPVKETEIKNSGGKILVSAGNNRKRSVAIVNAVVSELKNLFSGLKQDYEYRLEVVFSHFPMNISVKDGFVEVNNIGGAKMPKRAMIVGNSKVSVKGKDVSVVSSNKEHAGQTAANLETATRIKGKDRRIFQDGIYIVSKPKGV